MTAPDNSKKLNTAQQKAANHNKGPMLVLAGPGSGKTSVIITRTKNLIEKYNIPPQNILAVTFSKAAAEEMKERFFRQGIKGGSVTFSTLHSLCFGIIRNAGGYEHINILTEASRNRVIKEILDDMSSYEYKYQNSDFASFDNKHNCEEIHFEASAFGDEINAVSKKLSDEISRFKNSNLSCGFMPAEIIRPFFVSAFRAYERKKRSFCAIDFDDMLIYAFEILKRRPLLLDELHRRYTYILVDEFQDTNPLQYEILKLLASSEDNNFFAVGDDDQSIYGFRGAVPSVMKNFLDYYENAQTILLDINYRCHTEIVKTSAQLISFNKKRFEKRIIPANKSNNKKNDNEIVVLKDFETVNDECLFICSKLKEAARLKKDLSNIAILYRNSYEACTLSAHLKKQNIPYTAKEKIPNPYDHFICADITAYIRTAVNLISGKETSFARPDLLRIINKPLRYISRASLCAENSNSSSPCSNSSSRLLASMYRFYSDKPYMIKRIKKLESDLSFIAECLPLAAIKYIRHAIGYEKCLKEYAAEKKLDFSEFKSILSLLESTAADFKTNKQWLAFINDCSCNDQSAADRTSKAIKKGVHIMTMHACKGLEFDTVFIPQLNAGFIPHAKALTASEIEEERRLLYVAMTRAKNKLIISYDKSINEKTALPSPFWEEILPI